MRYAWVNMSTISDLEVSTICDGASMLCALKGTGISMVIASSPPAADFLASPRCYRRRIEAGERVSKVVGVGREKGPPPPGRRRVTKVQDAISSCSPGRGAGSIAPRVAYLLRGDREGGVWQSRARRASPLPAALRSAAMMSHTHTHARCVAARRTVRRVVLFFLAAVWRSRGTKNFFQNRRSRRPFRRLSILKVPTPSTNITFRRIVS